MKSFLYLALVLLIGCATKEESNDQIIIRGTISGKISEKVEYTLPIEGINYFGFENTIQPDSLGNFELKLPIEQASLIEFSSGFNSYGALIAEPGMEYDITINPNNKQKGFQIKSINKKGQEIYNQHANRSMLTGHFELKAREYDKDSIPSEIRKSLMKEKEEELAQYKALLDSSQISEDFYNLVSNDRSYFYAGAQSSIAFLNYLLEEREQNILNREQYNDLWADAFQRAPVSEKLMRSPWFFYYVQSYLRFKESTDGKYDLQRLSEIGKEGKTHTHNIEMAKTYLSGKILEYYYAAYLLYEAVNKNYEKELLGLFEEFKNTYPSSPYTHFVESEIIPIYSFYEKQKEKMSESIQILEDYENINSLKAAVAKLNAQRVYVDIWATWCGPCKKEFKFYAELHKLLKEENITMLYISIDEEQRAEKWREMMKYYQLDGYHIRANESLMKDLRRLRGQDTFGIPWHMLTDNNGNITVKYVSGPAQIETLKKQLQN